MITLRKHIFFFFLCTLLLNACNKKGTVDKATTSSSKTEKTVSPVGTWTVISFPSNTQETPNQKSYVVHFGADNSMGLTLDVNTCGTSYKVKDGMLTFQEGMTCTEACCDSKEANFLTSQFKGSLHYSIVGSLMTIKTDKGDIKLINNKDGIIGTSWTAMSYKNFKSDNLTKFEKTYRLSFDKKRMMLNLDVNTCNTNINYLPQISTFELPDGMGCTRKCCDSKEGIALMNALKGRITYQKTDNQLTLNTATQEINFVLYKEISKEE